MKLHRMTDIGMLTARKSDDSAYPGFYVDLKQKGKDMLPICNVEYDQFANCICVTVYGNTDSDEPTHVIHINVD